MAGTSRRAWTTAFTKKDMKPSLKPFLLTKSSWYFERMPMTADMSTSLKVVRSAALCCAETSRSAILWRSGVSFLRVWRSPDWGAAAGTFAGDGAGAGAAAAASMSPFVTRPSLPVPATLAGLTLVSSAILRTAGDCVAAACGAALGDAAAGKGEAVCFLVGAGAAPPAASIVATTWPIFTSAPASTFSVIAPAASAVPSDVILSVSSSKSGWSFFTASPFFTCHFARIPLLIDSPMGGILTSRGMITG